MYVNNELVTIQPIRDIAKITHNGGKWFHVDAVQATPYLKIDVKDLVEGDIVTYRAPDGVFVTHRIVGFLDDGKLELAGDVLHSVETIEPSWIQGVYVMRFAELGHVAEFIGSPWGLLVMLGVPALVLFIPDFFKKKKEQDKEKIKTLELQAELQKLREEKEALEKAKEAESASQEN